MACSETDTCSSTCGRSNQAEKQMTFVPDICIYLCRLYEHMFEYDYGKKQTNEMLKNIEDELHILHTKFNHRLMECNEWLTARKKSQ